ncbi:MAG: CinA family nicotinamide mononucleotide deamidase-related protein [Desulfobacteraceae bacterium]|nr:MAG: CinA family nicotinamide mononucleotide deamidase-related protein [Desulfobacteraceae bacterium]
MPLSEHNTIAVGSAYSSPTCEIITIGTELLLGQIVDTNTTYLARELGRAGVIVRFRTAVGDHLEEIIETLACAVKRCGMVVTTGGLGPTLDDLTREAVARTAGLELEFRQDLMEEIERIFRQFGYQMPENNRRQAFVPSGSHVISNPVGTAPAFITEVSGKPIVCLPGVPKELKFLLRTEVIHWLERRFDMSMHRLIYRVLKVVGLGESKVDQLIGDLIRSGQNPEVGLLASQGEIKIRIAARAGSDSEAQTLIGPIEKEIRSRLGNRIFGQDKDTLEGVIGSLLAKKGLILSTFETFTGGLAAQRLSHFPSSHITKCTVITDKKRVAQWLDYNNMEQVDETAMAIARTLKNAKQKQIGLAILGFPVKREESYSVKGCTAVAGEGIERSFSWKMGGDLNTLQQRGTVIGLNTLRLSLL